VLRESKSNNFAAAEGDGVPLLVLLAYVGILVGEHLGGDARSDGGVHFLLAGPDILEIDLLALVVDAQRLCIQVDIDRAGQRISNDQRWRRQNSWPSRAG